MYTPSIQEDRQSRMIVALIAFLISLPFVIGAIHDWVNPESVILGDDFAPTYEQFMIDRYEKMSDKDMLRSELRDDVEMRLAYDKIAASHWNRVRKQTRRDLLGYGALCLVSFTLFCFGWRAFRKEKQERVREGEREILVTNEKRGLVIDTPSESQRTTK